LRVYAAWLSESDQRAAATLSARMPKRPTVPAPRAKRGAYEVIADSLRNDIASGRLKKGDQLPTVVDLANSHGVAVGTAHRALALLSAEGLIDVARGRRATVKPAP
jgi:integrase